MGKSNRGLFLIVSLSNTFTKGLLPAQIGTFATPSQMGMEMIDFDLLATLLRVMAIVAVVLVIVYLYVSVGSEE